MRNVTCMSVLVLLTACGKASVSTNVVGIDQAFSQYASQFLTEASNQHVGVSESGISIQFDNSIASPLIDGESVVLGVCNFDTNFITINPLFWNDESVSNTMKEQVIFHELGHCVLHRQHLNDVEEVQDAPGFDAPVSIMNAYIFDSGFYTANRTVYLSELFHMGVIPQLWLYSHIDTSEPTYAKVQVRSDGSKILTQFKCNE